LVWPLDDINYSGLSGSQSLDQRRRKSINVAENPILSDN